MLMFFPRIWYPWVKIKGLTDSSKEVFPWCKRKQTRPLYQDVWGIFFCFMYFSSLDTNSTSQDTKLHSQYHPLCPNLGFVFDELSLSLIRYLHFPNPAILTFVNFTVSVPILIPKQPILSPPPLSNPNLITVTHYITVTHAVNSKAFIHFCVCVCVCVCVTVCLSTQQNQNGWSYNHRTYHRISIISPHQPINMRSKGQGHRSQSAKTYWLWWSCQHEFCTLLSAQPLIKMFFFLRNSSF